MKKKILLMTAMIVVLICIFTVSISAAEPSYKDGEWIYAEDGTTKLAIRDTDGNPLIWYMNGEELKYVRADQTDTTQDIYVVYKIEAGGNGFDADHTPTACLKDIDIYDNGTRIEGASINSQIVLLNVEKLEVDAFNGWLFGNYYGCCLLMRGMVFPSSLKYIGQEGLTNTKIVQYWNLENTKLEWINSYKTEPFSTTTLTQEATNYTIKFPSTLSTITSTLNSKVKTIIMNPNTTLANTCQAFRNCNSLEKLFVSASFYETGFANEAFRDITSKYLVFFAGTEEQAEALQNNTGSSHNGAFKSATRISYATYLADPSTYDNSTSTIYLIYDTNYCDAFYDGEHLEDNNPCVINCSQCNTYGVAEKNPVHNEDVTISYANGYNNVGSKITGCTNEGCKHNVTNEVKALFVCLGYSAPEDGRGGITIGFTVNNEAIKEYEDATGKILKYGVFAVLQSKLKDKDVFAEDGTAAEGVISAEITNYQFVAFELKIVGFTDEQKDTKLAMGAYVAVTDGETTEYSYLQSGTPNGNEKYCFVSYNDIVGAPSNDEEVTQ